MLTRKVIINLFEKISLELGKRGEKGEIGLVGGAVMCLVYNARASTKDVDAIFKPTKIIREIAQTIAKQEDLPIDWLNDGAKGFIEPTFTENEVLSLTNLRVWAPNPEYMLAMKCLSARWDTNDRNDVIFLIKFLKLKSAKSVFDIIENYYPRKQIHSKTQFFVEEIFSLNLD